MQEKEVYEELRIEVIEFETEEQAISWAPEEPALAAFLSREVTNEPGQTMGAYWLRTRGAGVQ